MAFLRVFGAVVMILLGFAAFFLGFLIAPFILLVVFYFGLQAFDRRRKESARRTQIETLEQGPPRAREEPFA